MDAIRKRLGPKKEVPRKIEISAPITTNGLVFGPGKVVTQLPDNDVVWVEPPQPSPEDDEQWKTDPFGVRPHPSYSERTDRPGRPNHSNPKQWKATLEKKNFKIVTPAHPASGSHHRENFTAVEDFEFFEENDPPRPAPSVEEQRRRYLATHDSFGNYTGTPPDEPRHVRYNVQRALERKELADEIDADIRAKKRAERHKAAKERAAKEKAAKEKSAEEKAAKEKAAKQASEKHNQETDEPVVPPTPPPKEPRKAARAQEQGGQSKPKAASAQPEPEPQPGPRLADVLKKPDYDYHSLSPEQRKDLDLLPPPVQYTGRHAQLRENLAKAKATKAANQPLGNSFVNNSVSTPAPDPAFWVGNEEAIYRPGKPVNRSASVSHKPPAGTPPRLTQSKYGSLSRAEGTSSQRRAEEKTVSSPAIERSKDPNPAPVQATGPQPRPARPTHHRTHSRDAVYYTPEDMQHSGFMGSSFTRPRSGSMGSVPTPSAPKPAPQPQEEREPQTASQLSSTPPLRIHKRNPSAPSQSQSPSRSVLDFAMATTSRAGSRQEGPPPVMRHRELIDANRPPVIKRPGRLDSLPIGTRSKSAKEEYFTPPPPRVDIDPIDGTRIHKKFGILPRRNFSTSAVPTAPSTQNRLSDTGEHFSIDLYESQLRSMPDGPPITYFRKPTFHERNPGFEDFVVLP